MKQKITRLFLVLITSCLLGMPAYAEWKYEQIEPIAFSQRISLLHTNTDDSDVPYFSIVCSGDRLSMSYSFSKQQATDLGVELRHGDSIHMAWLIDDKGAKQVMGSLSTKSPKLSVNAPVAATLIRELADAKERIIFALVIDGKAFGRIEPGVASLLVSLFRMRENCPKIQENNLP